MTRAKIIPVVLPCGACERPHHLACTLITCPDKLSPELRFTIPAHCGSCGEPLRTEQNDDDVRNTVSVLIWQEHHQRGAA